MFFRTETPCPRLAPGAIFRTMADNRPKCFFNPETFWDPDTLKLYVEFTQYRKSLKAPVLDGKPYSYTYHDVPFSVAFTFIQNDCDGVFYNDWIRNVYPWTRQG